MPIVLALLAAIGGAIWWWARANPRDALSLADDVVTTAANAPRRIAFLRRTRGHPLDGVDDFPTLVATLGDAFLGLDDLPTRDDRQRLNTALRVTWRYAEEETEELEAVAHWLVEQCGGPQPAFDRAARRLRKAGHGEHHDQVAALLTRIAPETGPSARQKDALEDLRIALSR